MKAIRVKSGAINRFGRAVNIQKERELPNLRILI